MGTETVARPRVFISSTFYNLKHVRADLENFVRSLGYEPVLHERGSIPYGHDQQLEEYCYKEIGLCDMVVTIIGGRFGTSSQLEPYSISQMELKTAVDLGKPLYIFVEQPVLAEFRTYQKNKDNESIAYAAVDNARVYAFLDEVESLPKNNATAAFNSVHEITSYLKEQWAGLFQRFLQEREMMKQINIVKDMQSTVDTLNQLVNYLTKQKEGSDEAIKWILTQNHPIFPRMARLTRTPYRVFFTTREEMARWLTGRGWKKRESEEWDDLEEEWTSESQKSISVLTVNTASIFDDNAHLKVITPDNWDDEWVAVRQEQKPSDDLDDEIPF